MSYILEALKKAQTERARGAVPGVDAQPVPSIAAPSPVGRAVWVAVVLGLLAAVATLLWLRPWTDTGLQNVARVPDSQPVAAPIPAVPKTKVMPSAAPMPAKPLRKLGEDAPPESPSTPAAPAPERIALLQELPSQIQREIPTLAINGYIYASNPADRSVLINNRLRREGDAISEGLVLEKLLPREMVLNYRGYRYRVSY